MSNFIEVQAIRNDFVLINTSDIKRVYVQKHKKENITCILHIDNSKTFVKESITTLCVMLGC